MSGIFYLTVRKNFYKILSVIRLRVECDIGEYKFEWDSEKDKINKQKHGISFKLAARVFLDENYCDDYDELHSDFEDRIKIVGRVGKVLTVIYTERGDRNRIISARQATKGEEEKYYGQFY